MRDRRCKDCKEFIGNLRRDAVRCRACQRKSEDRWHRVMKMVKCNKCGMDKDKRGRPLTEQGLKMHLMWKHQKGSEVNDGKEKTSEGGLQQEKPTPKADRQTKESSEEKAEKESTKEKPGDFWNDDSDESDKSDDSGDDWDW